MTIQSLFLVTLVVDDYDRAKTFYCDALGFDCLQDERQPEGKRWVVVKPKGEDGAAFLLAQAANAAQRAAIGNQTGGRVGFFLKTDDFMFLEVDNGNTAALGLYRKLGFEKVGERQGYYKQENGALSTALVMKRVLR